MLFSIKDCASILREVYILIPPDSIKESGSFKENAILKEILKNESIHNKIYPFSIDLVYSYNLLSAINLYDYDMCNVLILQSNSYILTSFFILATEIL